MSAFVDGYNKADAYYKDLVQPEDNKVTISSPHNNTVGYDGTIGYTHDLIDDQVPVPMDNPVQHSDGYKVGEEQVPMDNPVQHSDGYKVGNVSSNLDTFLTKLYNVETLGGKIADRKGSNYSGLAQLGRNERTPIIKKLGYSEEDYQKSRKVQDEVTRVWIDKVKAGIVKRGYEPTDLNVWIAHNQGLGGFSQIMKGKVSPTVLKNIRNQAGMDKNSTVKDYVKHYASRF